VKELRQVVEELISKYIKERPRKITLKLHWREDKSEISINGEKIDQTFEFSQNIDFTSFAHGVLEAYRKFYGELKVIPISFREEIYENDKVSLDLYPTGSAGIFDIFIEYKEKGENEKKNVSF